MGLQRAGTQLSDPCTFTFTSGKHQGAWIYNPLPSEPQGSFHTGLLLSKPDDGVVAGQPEGAALSAALVSSTSLSLAFWSAWTAVEICRVPKLAWRDKEIAA